MQLSATYIELDDFLNLIPYLHNGLYIDPNNSDLLYNLGVSYYETGLYKKSIKILEEYFIKNQNDLTASYYLGMSYYYYGDYYFICYDILWKRIKIKDFWLNFDQNSISQCVSNSIQVSDLEKSNTSSLFVFNI